MTILDQLAEHARERAAEAKKKIPPEEIRRQALSRPKGSFAFENALRKPGDFLYLWSQKGVIPQKGISLPIFHICELQRSTKRRERTVFPC